MQSESLPNKQALSKRLKKRRLEQKWSQRQLAKLAGVSPATVARMESEDGYVSSGPTIEALAKALACSAQWLSTGEPTRIDNLVDRVPPEHRIVARQGIVEQLLQTLVDQKQAELDLINLITSFASSPRDQSDVSSAAKRLRDLEVDSQHAFKFLTEEGYKIAEINTLDRIFEAIRKKVSD